MKLITKQALLIVLLLISVSSFGQNDIKKIPAVMSPEVASLGKYGTYNINYHTGNPDISVPLYSFSENGISIPIGLSYDASGFIPNKKSGIVGLNWNLISGGAITRIVNGQPDEKKKVNSWTLEDSSDHTSKGYIKGINEGLGIHSPDSIRKLQFLNMGGTGSPSSNILYEYQPDIFSFNFLGHYGKFFMDNAGTIQVQSDRRYKVDMSGFTDTTGMYDFWELIGAMNNTQINTKSISTIKITSDDGYSFYFGGALPALEMSFSYPSATSIAVSGTSARINAWYLTKVLTPDSNVIAYNYRTYTGLECNAATVFNVGASQGSWNTAGGDGDDLGYGYFDITLAHHDMNITNANENSGTNTINTVTKSLIKTAYLKEIVTKNQKITFLYSAKDRYKCFYKASDTSQVRANPGFFTRKLDKIIVVDILNLSPTFTVTNGESNYSATKSIEFSYDYIGSNADGWKLSLNHCTINTPDNRPQTYSFDYYDLAYSPDPLTRGVDIWGYYNGLSNTALIGAIDTSDSEFEMDFTSGNLRTPATGSTTAANMYSAHRTLTKITYPTGGTTEFVFENHKYRKVVKRKVSSGIIPVIDSLTSDADAGGLRIKKIINSPGITSEYFYFNNYPTSPGISSGILLNYPINFLYARIDSLMAAHGNQYPWGSGANPYLTIVSDNNLAPSSSYMESHIEYGHVVANSGDGYIKNTYSTFETNPDTYYLGDSSYRLPNPDLTGNHFNNQLKRNFKFSSRENERGKLLKLEVYKNGVNDPISTIQNFYNTDTLRTNQRAIAYNKYIFMPLMWLCHSYANYYYHDKVSKQVQTDRDPNTGNTMVSTINYIYKSNSNPLLTQLDMINSDGSHAITLYKYPEDYSGGIYDVMKNKFMVGAVLEEKIKKDTQQLKTITNQYYEPISGRVKLQSVTTQNHLFASSATNPYESVRFYKYDSSGNALEASKANDYKTAYKWDYQKTVVTAEIKNSEDSSVSYSSFETTNKDGWTYDNVASIRSRAVPMGVNAFALKRSGNAYNITRNISSSITYVLSLWHKDSTFSVNSLSPIRQFSRNGWQYNEYEISGASSITISGYGLVDELRLYPKGAFMTTYAHNPFYGITGQCDVNNRITYYEYDGFGRLVLVRDQDKKIIKKNCYNYSGQPDSCSFFFNVAKSGTYARSNCGYGYIPDSTTYTVPDSVYVSSVSQSYVDSLAQAEVYVNGQAHADTAGHCNAVTIYARMEWSDWYDDLNASYATVWIKFYSDYNCTTPFSVSNLSVNYDKVKTFCNGLSVLTTNYTVTCNGTYYPIGNQIIVKDGTPWATQCYYIEFMMIAGTGYTIF